MTTVATFARKNPDKTALIYGNAEHVESYGQLEARSRRIGHVLRRLGLEFGGIAQLLIAGALVFVCGGVVGGVLLGLYLLISVQVFGRHSNEAFSSLRIQDYKQWLRMHFAADGTLTIFAIGIDRVPRRTPDDPRATPPHLIEKVVLQR